MSSTEQDALATFIATSATYRYIWVAGYAWTLYDWLIALDQEIDLVWRQRSGAWKSKLLYVSIRYFGLAFITLHFVVIMRSNWSDEFCHVYLLLTGVLDLAEMCAVQGALLLRLYVMYERSFAVMATSIALFVTQLVSMAALYYSDIQPFIRVPAPASVTGCQALSQHPALAKVYWFICLFFETYMCGLALWSAYSHLKAPGTRGPNLLTILIRDSLLWYVCLSACLLLNALGFTIGMVELTLVGIPAVQCAATVGGSRFLLNLRAAYFASTGNMTTTLSSSRSRGTNFTQTKGTVGNFRPSVPNLTDEGDERERDCGGSIEMGLWVNEGQGTHDDGRSSPPAITLQPVPANRRIHGARPT